jgi:fatty-acyl-CoA synthase
MTIVGDAMALPLAAALETHPGRWKLERLAYIGSGGALFSEHLQQRLKAALPRVQLGNSMGSSEAGVLGMGGKPEGGGFIHIPARADLAIIVERSRRARPGEQGVLARTGNLPRGYYGDADKTAETFVTLEGRRYALTGDAARQEADGSFVVFGRGSNCINSGGEKVFPEEVEEALRSHPAVADALVVGVPDERWGERVTAVVSRLAGAPVSSEELRRYAHQRLAGYKVPKDIAFVDSVQRSVAGKADYAWAKRAMAEFLGVS